MKLNDALYKTVQEYIKEVFIDLSYDIFYDEDEGEYALDDVLVSSTLDELKKRISNQVFNINELSCWETAGFLNGVYDTIVIDDILSLLWEAKLLKSGRDYEDGIENLAMMFIRIGKEYLYDNFDKIMGETKITEISDKYYEIINKDKRARQNKELGLPSDDELFDVEGMTGW